MPPIAPSAQVVPETEFYNEIVLDLFRKLSDLQRAAPPPPSLSSSKATSRSSSSGASVSIDVERAEFESKRQRLFQRLRKAFDKLETEVLKISGHNEVAEKVGWRLRLVEYEAMLAAAERLGATIVPKLSCDPAGVAMQRLAAYFHEVVPLETLAFVVDRQRQLVVEAEQGSGSPKPCPLLPPTPTDATTAQIQRVLRGNIADRLCGVLGIRSQLLPNKPSANDLFLISFMEEYVLNEAASRHGVTRDAIPFDHHSGQTNGSAANQEKNAVGAIVQEMVRTEVAALSELAAKEAAVTQLERDVEEQKRKRLADQAQEERDAEEMRRLKRQAEALLEARAKAAAAATISDDAAARSSSDGGQAAPIHFRVLPDPHGKSYDELRRHLVAFYARFNPEKVESVDDILAQYGDCLTELFSALELKYCPDDEDGDEDEGKVADAGGNETNAHDAEKNAKQRAGSSPEKPSGDAAESTFASAAQPAAPVAVGITSSEPEPAASTGSTEGGGRGGCSLM